MKLHRIVPVVLMLWLVALGLSIDAQPRGLSDMAGRTGLALALRELANTGIYVQTGAHPDDEGNGVFVMLKRGLGVRTALVLTTRGTGGQNEIGPELFEALAVLRTEELASVHRYDGAEQYFARAIDFGYSFGIEETFEKWGRDEILADYVRLIRMIRPDVVATMRPDGAGGGQHHQAQARLTGEAFRLAADPAKYPEQMRDGLRPWQASKLYYAEYGSRTEPRPADAPRLLTVNTDVYDPLLGRTYAEIGSEARGQHKCQGMAQLLALPGPQASSYRLGDTTLPGGIARPDASLFDGVDTTIPGLARFVPGQPPAALTEGLAAVAREVSRASRLLDTEGLASTKAPIAAGLRAVRALRSSLGSMGLDEMARFEIDLRLETKEQQFQRAAVLAQGIRVDVLADDGVVIGGQPVRVQAIVANRDGADVRLLQARLEGFDGDGACETAVIKAGGVYRCQTNVTVPLSARLTSPYWRPLPDAARYELEPDAPFGLPFRPTPFRMRVDVEIEGERVAIDAPVLHRYEGNIFSGEKRMELLVVPRFSVATTPDIIVVPSGRGRAPAARAGQAPGPSRELRVVVVNGSKGGASVDVALQVPPGWTYAPASAHVEFTREDAAETVRFTLVPPPGIAPGQHVVRAVVRAGGETFDRGYQVVEYPHTSRRHRIVPAETSVKAIDVTVAPALTVGYVMGVGDQVPPAIEQLGARVRLLDADALAWGDLSAYDAIVTGVRAYERRPDLRANNRRLLAYAEQGGTVIVQYNKTEFNEAQFGPFPARVSSSRVTDERAPVEVLAPESPVFTFPNRIGADTWKNWVQERGLYFLGDKDPRYVDLVQLEDPFPYNKGTKRGALVEARVGKGRWIYVGLGLWRQLPAGTDGAYQLLANLISIGRAAKPSTAPRKLL